MGWDEGWGGDTSITSLYRYAPPLTPLFKANVVSVDLALRTVSPIDPEYYGTCPPSRAHPRTWILKILSSAVGIKAREQQQHVGPMYTAGWA